MNSSAEELAGEAGISHLELDLINWRPGWYNHSAEEPEAFVADVDQATSQGGQVLRCTTRHEIDQARQSLVALTRARSAA